MEYYCSGCEQMCEVMDEEVEQEELECAFCGDKGSVRNIT